MFIGIYFCLGGLFVLLSFLIFPVIRKERGKFVFLSIAILALIFVLFELTSNYFKIIEYGTPGSSNFPGDYLASGLVGWTLLFLPFLGVISPLLVSLFLHRTGEQTD